MKKEKSEIYNPAKIESKWQKKWRSADRAGGGSKDNLYKTKEDSKKDTTSPSLRSAGKFYVLDMFPYPSGEGLHVGHPKGYIATDIISRMNRMQGKSVLHPMGFDAFGLPAENYAIKTKTNPADSVAKNVERYKKQLEILGFDYDWSREINTTDPNYYKWTQWIFLEMWKKGLAYESNEPINWCPSCKTGLANEDVEDGRCERCGTPVEKKSLRQWVLKITDYAERLLADLDVKKADGTTLLDWPNSIKEAQRNWIGKSEGAEIDFEIRDLRLENRKMKVFTTRPDTLFGVTYVVLAPEHKLVKELMDSNIIENKSEVEAYIAQAGLATEIDRTDAKKEKTGVQLKGINATNPVNSEQVPVWIADYVLADYGTGAVMAVPAHDERDFAFAKKFGLEMKEVISPLFVSKYSSDAWRESEPEVVRPTVVCIIKHWSEDKYLFLNKKELADLGRDVIVGVAGGVDNNESHEVAGAREILEETGYKNVSFIKDLGSPVSYRYYSKNGKQNRLALLCPLYFELKDGEQVEVSEHEKELHQTIWLKEDEMSKYLDGREFNIIFWERFKGKSSSYTNPGLLINSGKFDGKHSELVKKEITKFAGGKMKTTYKLRDWVFSRQRYWGEPIPLIHCEKCALQDPSGRGVVPVPEKDLPVKLPKVKSYEPTGTGESPLAGIHKWVNVVCPKCKGIAKRETNTMPQWAGSSWYYIAYIISQNLKSKDLISNQIKEPKFKESINHWLPVDMYVGGAEHATRHLIYARFWHKFLFDLGIVSTIEPFIKLQHVGLIIGEDGRKMSKRFGNVVNPDDVVKAYGADTVRLYEMFMGPFDQQIAWSTASMVGTRRFIEKVWRLRERLEIRDLRLEIRESQEQHVPNVKLNDSSTEHDLVLRLLHKAIKKIAGDINSMSFNTAISTLMITVNELEKITNEKSNLSKEQFEILIKLLAPFAPHVTEELWYSLGNKTSIHISEWPIFDENLIVDNEINIVVQINGKVRGSFKTSINSTDSELENKAKELPEIIKWTEGKVIKKIIVIKGKLVSIVI